MLYAVQRRIKNEEHMIHTLIHINPCMFIARGLRADYKVGSCNLFY